MMPVVFRSSALKLALMSFSPVLLIGCGSDHEDTSIGSLPHHGSHTPHTDVAQGVWPPQPLEITNERLLPPSARARVQGNVVEAARGIVMNNPNVRQALGSEFVPADGSSGDAKSDTTASFLFFSYTNNQTVAVELARSGEVTHQTYAASDYQPAEQPEERDRAIALADEALGAAGFDTSGLAGTALLANPSASDATNSGRVFYPQRLVYVTFGVGNGEMPTYSALVNLNTGVVTEEGVIQ